MKLPRICLVNAGLATASAQGLVMIDHRNKLWGGSGNKTSWRGAGFTGWGWRRHPAIFHGGWILAGGLWLSVLVLRLSWRDK